MDHKEALETIRCFFNLGINEYEDNEGRLEMYLDDDLKQQALEALTYLENE